MLRRAIAGMLTLALALAGLLAPARPARAAVGQAEMLAATTLLVRYDIVAYSDTGYRWQDTITRSEVAKLLVHSLGFGPQAESYKGRGAFPDTAGHWSDGVTALAKELGVMTGYPNGRFGPTDPVTNAEIITALSRLVGLEASPEVWPRTYLAPARKAGIIPAEMLDLEQRLTQKATRGEVFVLLKRTLADVRNTAGQTLLQRYLDRSAPVLLITRPAPETKESAILITGTVQDAAQVLVNGEPASLLGGSFSHLVRLKVGLNAITVRAIDEAGNVREEKVSITRLPGQPGSISLIGPTEVAVGQSARFVVSVRDEFGEDMAGAANITAVVTPADMGQFDPATGIFAAGTKLGTAALTMRAGAMQSTTAIHVVPGPLERLTITPAEAALAPGQSLTFQVKGADAFGNPVPVFGALWSATGGTMLQNGFYQAPAAVTGPVNISVTAAGKTATATVQPMGYQADGVRLTAPATGAALRANGQGVLILTATMVDDKGAPVPTYRGTVTVSSSAPGLATPVETTVQVVNGVAAIPVRAGLTTGQAWITVTTDKGRSASLAVTVEPQRVQSVQLSGYSQPGPDGAPQAVVEAVALDQEGFPMRSALPQTLVLGLTLPGDAATFISTGRATADLALGGVDSATGDVRARTYITYSATSGTIMVEGTVKSGTMSWVTVAPGAVSAGQAGRPARLHVQQAAEAEAGASQTIFVDVLDANGYRVTQPGPLTGVQVSLRDQNGQVFPVAVTPQMNQGRAQFNVMQIKSGTYTYTATLQPGGATVAMTTTVRAGTPTQVTLVPDLAELPADGTSQTTLRAEILDVYGNRVALPAHTVRFSVQAPGNGALQNFTDIPVSTVGGVATYRVTAGRVSGAVDTVQAEVTGLPPVTTTITTRGTPHSLRLRYPDPGANVGRAGTPVTVAVDVLDNLGNVITYEASRQVTLTVRNVATGAETTLNATAAPGKPATFLVNRPQAGTYALKAESTGVMKALSAGYGGATPDLVLQPGATLGLRVSPDLTRLQTGDGTSYSLVTVQLLDGNQNVTANQTGLPIVVTLSLNQSTSAPGYFTVDDSRAGFKAQTRTVTILPGASASAPVRFFSSTSSTSATIGAATADGMTASATVSMVGVGAIAQLTADPVSPVAWEPWANADSAVTGQTVTVTVKDAGGNRLTQYGTNGEMLTFDPGSADVVLVAYLDPATHTWKSLDGLPGDGTGSYTATLIPTDRGQATFRIRSSTPGTKVFAVRDAASGRSTTITGQLNPPGPSALTVDVGSGIVAAGGSQLAITVRVVDVNGNLVRGVTGPVTLVLSTGNYGHLISSVVDLHDGVAVAHFQSTTQTITGDHPVTIFASVQFLTVQGQNTVTVDGP